MAKHDRVRVLLKSGYELELVARRSGGYVNAQITTADEVAIWQIGEHAGDKDSTLLRHIEAPVSEVQAVVLDRKVPDEPDIITTEP